MCGCQTRNKPQRENAAALAVWLLISSGTGNARTKTPLKILAAVKINWRGASEERIYLFICLFKGSTLADNIAIS